MRRKAYLFVLTLLTFSCIFSLNAQDMSSRGMTAEEYKLAKSTTVENLDEDTYVKVGEGDYVLDRYEMKPPYFITGDSGIKKRIDTYKFIERENMDELGLVVYFTNTEAKETFNLVIPNMATAGEVWNMYFDDIHQHDREEGDVALKMSYVLSKEVAYLLQKSSGADMSAMDQNNSDYDFCFTADALVNMADGSKARMEEVKVGDVVLGFRHGVFEAVKVEGVSIHAKQEIALTKVLLIPTEQVSASLENTFSSEAQTLVATPNHPVWTAEGTKALGELSNGDLLYYYDAQTHSQKSYQVYAVWNNYSATERVYSLSVAGDTYLVDNFVVMEK